MICPRLFFTSLIVVVSFLCPGVGMGGYQHEITVSPGLFAGRVPDLIKGHRPVMVRPDAGELNLAPESNKMIPLSNAVAAMYGNNSMVTFWRNAAGVLMVTIRISNDEALTITAEEFRTLHSLWHSAYKERLAMGGEDFVRPLAPGTIIVRPEKTVQIPQRKPQKQPENQKPEDMKPGQQKTGGNTGVFGNSPSPSPFGPQSFTTFNTSPPITFSFANTTQMNSSSSNPFSAPAPQQNPFSVASPSKVAAAQAIARLNALISPTLTLNKPDSTDRNNVVYSPFSLAFPLALLGSGAGGVTLNEFNRLVAGGNNPTFGAGAQQSIRQVFEGLVEITKELSGSKLISVGNAIITRTDVSVTQEFQNLIHRTQAYIESDHSRFGWQPMNNLHTDGFREYINKEIREFTHGKIPVMLKNNLTEDTVLLVINAVYFKAQWKKKLQLVNNFEFQSDNGGGSLSRERTGAVRYESCSYAKTVSHDMYGVPMEWDVVWLPFGDLNYGVVLAMPPANQHDNAFQNHPDIFAKAVDRIFGNERTTVDAVFPKMKVETGRNLVRFLNKPEGIPSTFSAGSADFTPLFGFKGPYINHLMQKAIFELDEVGVQAAAATACGATNFCGRIAPPEIRFDRPFKTFLVYKPSKLLLFEATIKKTPPSPNLIWQ